MTIEHPARDPELPNAPLEAWMIALSREATDVDDDAIPRDMMWARIQQQRKREKRAVPLGARVAAIAALLLGAFGVGRYLVPAPASSVATASSGRADSAAVMGLGPDALMAMPHSAEPARVAMDEHLARTVSLLTTVRNDDTDHGPGADLRNWASDLLGTTRLLLDEPQLRDERTKRLLQDLELVLAQIVQARGSAPAITRAPGETMRETNLLPRMRAAVNASRRGDDPTLGGSL